MRKRIDGPHRVCRRLNGVLRLVSRTDAEWEAIFAPYFSVERLAYYAWQGEEEKTRRLFFLKKTREVIL
ncbi:MAG: hypothetical protein II412_00275 [Clostridia bacterium]|nr:hypothetical protein [Clostridia bacterium]